MNAAQLTAATSPAAMPHGLQLERSAAYSPLANTVPNTMISADTTWLAAGGRRVMATWITVPIHVNWNSSVNASGTGSTLMAYV